MRPFLILCAFFVCVGAASILLGREAAIRLENEVQQRADIAQSAANLGWPRVTANGLTLTIRGEAPNEAQRTKALEQIGGSTFGLSVRDETTVRASHPPYRPEPKVELLREVSALTLTGATPGAATQTTLIAALKRAAPSLLVTDLTRRDATGEGWDNIADDIAHVAVSLLHGRIILQPGQITVLGLAAGDVQQSEIDERVAEIQAAGWQAQTYLATPPRALTAQILHIETGSDGRGVIECTATSTGQAAALSEAIKKRLDLPATCTSINGDEDTAWGNAAMTAINTMTALRAGEIRLSARTVRLIAAASTREQSFRVASASLKTALPDGFNLISLRTADAPTSDDTAPLDGNRPLLTIAYYGKNVTLSGDAPSPVLAQSIAAFTRALLPGTVVQNDMAIRSDLRPGDWRAAAMTMVSTLPALESGTGWFNLDTAMLEGVVRTPAEVSKTHNLLIKGLGANRQVISRFEVAVAAQSLAQKLPAARCAEEMTAITTRNPIVFEAGSTDMDADSLPVIADLVELMNRCAEGLIEIGGHTDSQGSEATNLRISRARAEAVLAAMTVAGASLHLLSARGYGEAHPVGDNSTKDGRAANRRIEFRVVTETKGDTQ